jgi:hypothetical protein
MHDTDKDVHDHAKDLHEFNTFMQGFAKDSQGANQIVAVI